MNIVSYIKRNSYTIIFTVIFVVIFYLRHIIVSTPKKEALYGLDFTLTYKTGNVIKKRSVRIDVEDKKSSDCNYQVDLPNIADFTSLKFGVIMMETSGLIEQIKPDH